MSKQEHKALTRLRKLEEDWPSSLWVFAADGRFHVMRYDEHGERYVTPDGGMDHEAVVETFDIPCDGGDW